MKCNWRRWLWGIIPLLVLSWVAVQAEHGRLERDLAERARLALVGGGFAWAMTEFKARDAILTGRAPQESEPGKAADALASVWGVRVVDNKAGLLDKAEIYLWSASRRKNRIRLTGYAPSIAARQAILGVTKASFPGFEVVDRTTLARGVPSNDIWLAGVSFGLKQLTFIRRGDARMRDLELSVYGEAEDIAGYRAVKQAIAHSVPKGIKVTVDSVTAPVVRPYTWAAQFADGRLVLSGYVPNDAVRAGLVATARASLPGTVVVDKMEPGEGAPQGWAGAASASLRELARLEGGGVEFEGCRARRLRHGGGRRDGRGNPHGPARSPADDDQVRRPNQGEGAATPTARSPPAAGPPKRPRRSRRSELPARRPSSRLHRPRPWCGPKPARRSWRASPVPGRSSSGLPAPSSIPSAPRPLDKLAEAAKSCPGMHIEVSGHASAEGSAEINRQLSLKRAQSVVAYLVQAGVDAAQLEPVGFGATRPIAPNDSSENMARNRRIEFAVRPK